MFLFFVVDSFFIVTVCLLNSVISGGDVASGQRLYLAHAYWNKVCSFASAILSVCCVFSENTSLSEFCLINTAPHSAVHLRCDV